MAGSSRLAPPTIERIRPILKQIDDGDLLVPQFQRSFVWSDDQRLQLLDSVRKGMPIGSVLVWRTRSFQLSTSEAVGPFPIHAPSEHGSYAYLLDGLQRLATLYGALWGRTTSTVAEGETRWPILYDLEAEEFRLPPRRGKPPVTWIEVWRLFDGRGFYEHEKRLIEAKRETERQRAEVLRDVFGDYVIPIISIQSEDIEQVTEAFRRVNSQGTKMSELHMVNAVGHASELNIARVFDDLREELVALGWGGVDRQILLNAAKIAMGIDYYRADPQHIHKELKKNSALTKELLPALRRAIDFLDRECGVAGPKMLPYDPQLVLLTEAARVAQADLTGDLAERLRLWFWQTTYTEYFTGASNAKLRRAVAHMKHIVTGGGLPDPDDLDRRVDPIASLRANSVRTIAFLLFLATMKPCSLEGELPAAKLLAQGGLDAAPKIFRRRDGFRHIDTDGVENRWIMPAEQSAVVLNAILSLRSSSSMPWSRLLEGHGFLEEAASALGDGDLEGGLAARREELLHREKSFVEHLGLKYGVGS